MVVLDNGETVAVAQPGRMQPAGGLPNGLRQRLPTEDGSRFLCYVERPVQVQDGLSRLFGVPVEE